MTTSTPKRVVSHGLSRNNMIEYRKGNLLDVKHGIIVHGCNSQGVMGSGVALAVKQEYPNTFDKYQKACRTVSMSESIVGIVVWTSELGGDLLIANAITQEKFGRNYDERYVSYDAIDDCFRHINNIAEHRSMKVHIPKIGAGLGNGNWGVIAEIINHRCKDISVTCWEYNGPN